MIDVDPACGRKKGRKIRYVGKLPHDGDWDSGRCGSIATWRAIAVSDHLKEIGRGQTGLRVAFACGITLLVVILVYCVILWLVRAH